MANCEVQTVRHATIDRFQCFYAFKVKRLALRGLLLDLLHRSRNWSSFSNARLTAVATPDIGPVCMLLIVRVLLCEEILMSSCKRSTCTAHI